MNPQVTFEKQISTLNQLLVTPESTPNLRRLFDQKWTTFSDVSPLIRAFPSTNNSSAYASVITAALTLRNGLNYFRRENIIKEFAEKYRAELLFDPPRIAFDILPDIELVQSTSPDTSIAEYLERVVHELDNLDPAVFQEFIVRLVDAAVALDALR